MCSWQRDSFPSFPTAHVAWVVGYFGAVPNVWRDATPGCGAQYPRRRNRRQRSAAAPGVGVVLRISVPRGRGAVTRQRSTCGLVDAPAFAVSTSRGILRRGPPLSRPCCRACIAPPEAVAREEHQGTTLEVNARARRKPTQLGNRGGLEDVMRACAPASGRWRAATPGGRSPAVPDASFRPLGGGEGTRLDIPHSGAQCAVSFTKSLYLLQVGGSFVSCRRVYWTRSVTGAVRD